MELDAFRLKAFVEVTKTGNFSKAAKNLSITQSALSQRVAKLEDELETTLLIRATSGIRLTAAGQELLRYCNVKRDLEEEFLTNLKKPKDTNQLSGVIRIAGYSSIMRSVVMPTLKGLLTTHPQIQLETYSRELEEIPSLLYRGETDFIIMNKELEKNELEAVLLAQEENVHITSSNKTPRKDWYLDHDHEDPTTHDYFRLQGRKNIHLKRSLMDDVYGIIDGVKLGFGSAVVSKHLVKKERGIKILTGKKRMINPIVLHYFKRPYYSKLHEAVVEYLKTRVKLYI